MRTNPLLVDAAISRKMPLQGPSSSQQVTVEGVLVCTSFFSYVASDFRDDRGILLYGGTDEPPIVDRLLQCAPPMGGSHVIYSAPCTIDAQLAHCVLPMFPRVLHDITRFIYDGHQLIRDGDSYVLDPPLSYDDTIDDGVDHFRDSLYDSERQHDKTCKREGCDEPPITLSLFCPAHHYEMLHRKPFS